MNVRLYRMEFYDDGTFGVLTLPSGRVLYTIEQPWKNNRRSRSCIPAGEYLCVPRISPRFGKTYHVKNVPDRSHILFHAANLAGDREKGYKSHLEGCIALGLRRGYLSGQRAILKSRQAVDMFQKELDWQDFTLVIDQATS